LDAQQHPYNTRSSASPKLLIGMAVTSHDNSGNDDLGEGLHCSFSVSTYAPTVDPQVKIVLDKGTGKVRISWASGTLSSSATVNGTYTPVSGATSPYEVTPTTTTFFKVSQ
jgi:hypothetical protein